MGLSFGDCRYLLIRLGGRTKDKRTHAWPIYWPVNERGKRDEPWSFFKTAEAAAEFARRRPIPDPGWAVLDLDTGKVVNPERIEP